MTPKAASAGSPARASRFQSHAAADLLAARAREFLAETGWDAAMLATRAGVSVARIDALIEDGTPLLHSQATQLRQALARDYTPEAEIIAAKRDAAEQARAEREAFWLAEEARKYGTRRGRPLSRMVV